MNKLKLLSLCLLSLFLIQSCKKDTVVGTAYTTAAFQANINGVTWAPDTISSTISFSSGAKTFSLIGTKDQKQVILSVTLNNASNTNGFTPGNYTVDGTSVLMQYNTKQKNSSGNYVFLPQGTVTPGGGVIHITAVDSVKKQITGTFSFYSRSSSTDSSGNLSITIDNILDGVFNAISYNFSSN